METSFLTNQNPDFTLREMKATAGEMKATAGDEVLTIGTNTAAKCVFEDFFYRNECWNEDVYN